MTIRPIRDDHDLERALREMEALWGAPEGSEEADRLEVLAILVDVYERQCHPLPPPDPVEAIQFHLEQRGLTARDLEPLIGSRTRVYEVLTGRRPLTLRMIRNLARELEIPADVLVGVGRGAPLPAPRPARRRNAMAALRREVRSASAGFRPDRRDAAVHGVRFAARTPGQP